MTQEFHPTTWIDDQRAGRGGNVFDEILQACARIRKGQVRGADYRADRRVAQVHEIRREAALFDRAVDPRGTAQVPGFGELLQRWKGLR